MSKLLILHDRPSSQIMMQTVFKTAKNLAEKHEVIVLSSVREKPSLDFKHEHYFLFEDARFKTMPSLSTPEIHSAQRDLGVPFKTVFDAFPFHGEYTPKSEEFIAKMVLFWRHFIRTHKITHYVGTLESMPANLVGVQMLKNAQVNMRYISVSRLGGGAIILDENFMPVLKDFSDKEIGDAYDTVKKNIGGKPVKMKLAKIHNPFKFPDVRKHLSEAYDYYFKFTDYERMNSHSILNLMELKVRRMARSVINAHYCYQKPLKLDEKYYLFPLYYPYESYNSFVNYFYPQFLLIEHIARALPTGYTLLVKPHPHYKLSEIETTQAQRLAQIPNVRLLPLNTTPLDVLVASSQGVITVSATTGINAFLMDKPVIVFGHPFYEADGTVSRVDDLGKLSELILYSRVELPNKLARMRFIGKYVLSTIPISCNPSSNWDFEVTDEEAKLIADGCE